MKTRKEIIEVLKEARKTIKIWHDMGTEHFQKEVVWRMYENSPEIKRLDAMIKHLAQQPDKELYEKVYIRSEEDLPREVGNYPVHQIGFEPDYVMSMYYNGLSDNFWMQAYDWYLRPLE